MFTYYNKKENKLIKKFEKDGFLIFDIKRNKKKIDQIKELTNKEILKLFIKKKILLKKEHKSDLFNKFHFYIKSSELNQFRMSVYDGLNKQKKFLQNYFEIAKQQLEILCGNELAMQRKVNLSVQMPKDDSSLLPIHSDVWSGCSPFEVVLWVPLVNCSKTKSMYILPKKENEKLYKKFYKYKNPNDLYKGFKKKIKWINIKYGQGLIFTHQLMHGNLVNKSNETRWSFNCRFKSLMSPYDKKKIAETFLPISIRPATRFGMNYEEPKT
ncbi:2OG-Fe(II) oxygenase [Candidatus Pelagibacter ubique]|nr:2OG-Fe(II) oxygenase [Candidatus Pelagibacter ubique]